MVWSSDISDAWEEKKKSAELTTLLKELANEGLALLQERYLETSRRAELRVAVIGPYSSGKSSFINAILELEGTDDACEVSVTPQTNCVTEFKASSEKGGVLADKTKPPIEDGVPFLTHLIDSSALQGLTILDTPGLGNPEKKDGGKDELKKSIEAIIKSDVLVLVLDCNHGGLAKEVKEFLNVHCRRTDPRDERFPILVVFNKSDQKSPTERKDISKEFNKFIRNDKLNEVVAISEQPIFFSSHFPDDVRSLAKRSLDKGDFTQNGSDLTIHLAEKGKQPKCHPNGAVSRQAFLGTLSKLKESKVDLRKARLRKDWLRFEKRVQKELGRIIQDLMKEIDRIDGLCMRIQGDCKHINNFKTDLIGRWNRTTSEIENDFSFDLRKRFGGNWTLKLRAEPKRYLSQLAKASQLAREQLEKDVFNKKLVKKSLESFLKRLKKESNRVTSFVLGVQKGCGWDSMDKKPDNIEKRIKSSFRKFFSRKLIFVPLTNLYRKLIRAGESHSGRLRTLKRVVKNIETRMEEMTNG